MTRYKLFGLLVAPLLAIGLFAGVASAESYGGGSVAGYSATSKLDIGSVVRLTKSGSDTVELATQKDMQNMFGVVVDKNQLALTLSNGKHKNETFVAVSGTYNVLVNDQNGTISTGDYVTMSSVNGIAMKAGTRAEQATVFGRAQAGFDGKSNVLGTTTLKDVNGKDRQNVSMGLIPVTIKIERNPNDKSTKVDVPEFLERLGQQIADKRVSPIRIYISLAITAVSLITALVVLYSGVRNGVISIGRNPMSKKSIFRALLEVILTAVVILIIGLFAVYLLLKL